MSNVKNRSEVIFIYDAVDMNPNGDPLDENKPRIDEEVGINLVTDVRLKRTIRDYLKTYEDQEIFIRSVLDKKGYTQTKEARLQNFKDDAELLKNCIDVRLFGVTVAVKDKVITYTGPVQFNLGRSLHRVDMQYLKGTTVMPAKNKVKQGTFTERYILPYSLIRFHGIVNENMADVQNLSLTESDLELLFKGMWNGTKNLASNSKMGQTPRVLFQVIYKEKNFQIGELDKRIKLVKHKRDEQIRDIEDVSLDITSFINILTKYEDMISCIRYKVDDRVQIIYNKEEIDIDALNIGNLKFEAMTFI